MKPTKEQIEQIFDNYVNIGLDDNKTTIIRIIEEWEKIRGKQKEFPNFANKMIRSEWAYNTVCVNCPNYKPGTPCCCSLPSMHNPIK